ncbi:MAG: beta-lactamase family protein, partial [Pseudomonadales bacterium]|nr:beta-lactamase family protein [Pseudomonadales bacterium]
GFSYGIFLESPIDAVYNERNLLGPNNTLANMVEQLGDVPLAYQPGKRWQYSVSADILAALIEVWSGKSFAEFLRERIFEPLDMPDTDFHVPEDKHDRFATNYVPVDPMDPMKPGLNAAPDQMLGNLMEPRPYTSGGGGLVSTIGDYTNFIRMLIAEGEGNGFRILKPETVRMMHTNQLPDGVQVQLPNWFMPDTVFGLGLAIKTAPADGEPPEAVDEFHWGGIAGTHSWIAPRANLAAIVFTQRLPGFWHPYYHDHKRLVYSAAADNQEQT